MEDKLHEFLMNNGWSAKKFFALFDKFRKAMQDLDMEMKVGRTVLHLKSADEWSKFKIYPHHKGLTNEWITLVKYVRGIEVVVLNFHYQKDINVLINTIEKECK